MIAKRRKERKEEEDEKEEEEMRDELVRTMSSVSTKEQKIALNPPSPNTSKNGLRISTLPFFVKRTVRVT